MIIALDFDNTIVYDKYPEIGELKPNAKQIINLLYNRGHKILIWSCRGKTSEVEAIKFLEKEGVKFHTFNANLQERIEFYDHDSRKLGYDVLIDDRNLGGIPDDWDDILELLVEQFGEKI